MTFVTLDLVSRRRVLTGAAKLAIGTMVLGATATATAMAEQAKSSQKAVEYQHHAKAGHSCNTCKDFKPPQSCKTVEGVVEASGWCNKYTHT
jgi:hypothetical protein